MVSGFAKLRRGILEHLEDGRITVEEYAVYTVIILKADYRSGSWLGCALALSRKIRKSERWCQRIMAALRSKGYITGEPSNGRGQYMIKVVKFFKKASVVTPSAPKGVCGDTLRPNKASVVTPYEEVIQEELQKKSTAQTRRGHSLEQVRQIQAKNRRLNKEEEGWREAQVGRNPFSEYLHEQLEKIGKEKAL